MARQIFNSEAVRNAKRSFGFDPNDATDVPKMTSEEVLTELQDSSELLQKIVFNTGIKNSGIVPVMRGDFPLNKWTDCSIADDATLSFEDITVVTTPLGFAGDFCSRTLVGKWTAMGLASGLLNEMKSLPFETQAKAIAIAGLRANIENILINGDTASPDSSLNHLDGYAKIIKISALSADTFKALTYAGTSITALNAYDNFKGVARAFSDKVKESTKTKAIWCNAKMFDFLTDNLEADNNFHYSAKVEGEGNNRTLILPSTGVRVEVQRGLADDSILGIVYENLVAGTDIDSDMATVEVVTLTEARKMRLEAGCYIGANIAFPEEFVYFAV